jgi:hypothetical protein
MGKMKLCISCVIFLVSFAGTGFSETIILKSGQRVDAKITENTEQYVKLDFLGVELVYYKDEIASIVPGNDVVSPQLKSLYQAYSSSLNIPPKPKEERLFIDVGGRSLWKQSLWFQAFSEAIYPTAA